MQALDRAQWALPHILLPVCFGLEQPASFNIYIVVHSSVWKVSPVKTMKAQKLFLGRKYGLKSAQLVLLISIKLYIELEFRV